MSAKQTEYLILRQTAEGYVKIGTRRAHNPDAARLAAAPSMDIDADAIVLVAVPVSNWSEHQYGWHTPPPRFGRIRPAMEEPVDENQTTIEDAIDAEAKAAVADVTPIRGRSA